MGSYKLSNRLSRKICRSIQHQPSSGLSHETQVLCWDRPWQVHHRGIHGLHQQQKVGPRHHQRASNDVQGSQWSQHGRHLHLEMLEGLSLLQQLQTTQVPDAESHHHPAPIPFVPAQEQDRLEAERPPCWPAQGMGLNAGGLQTVMEAHQEKPKGWDPHQLLLN